MTSTADLSGRHGRAGLVIDGAVRDVAALAGLDLDVELGVEALGCNPRRSVETGAGVPVGFGGVTVVPRAQPTSDDDGIVVLG